MDSKLSFELALGNVEVHTMKRIFSFQPVWDKVSKYYAIEIFIVMSVFFKVPTTTESEGLKTKQDYSPKEVL